MRKDIAIQMWTEHCEDAGAEAAKRRKHFHQFMPQKYGYELMIMGGMVRVSNSRYGKYEMTFFSGTSKAEILKQRNPKSASVLKFNLGESEYEKLKNIYNNGRSTN